jgi:CBS domain-containing membrane protein
MNPTHPPLLQRWLRHRPEPSSREILISAAGALLAIVLTAAVGRYLLHGTALPFLVASMGASAVILYALPTSPMAQPWSLVGGHLISAWVGVTCARYIPDQAMAAAVAAAGAILAMHYLRCMHPPGGATALMPIAAPKLVGALGYTYMLTPVGIDVALMLALALVINTYLLRRPYPAARARDGMELFRHAHAPRPLSVHPPFDDDDLHRAIQTMDTYIDVEREDLHKIYSLALVEAYRRKAGEHLCGEIMEPAKVTLAYGDDLASAFKVFGSLAVDGLPVTTRAGHLQGTLSLADFQRHARDMPGDTDSARLRQLLQPTHTVHSEKPEVVGQIMDTAAPTAKVDQPLAEIVERLSHSPAAIVPVLDDQGRLVGVLRRQALLGRLGAAE